MEDSIVVSLDYCHFTSVNRHGTEGIPLLDSIAEATGLSSSGLARPRIKPLVYGIVAASALGNFLWGYNLSVVAGAMLPIVDHFHLHILWHQLIVSVLVGGAAIGAFMAGVLTDRFGRWWGMMIAAVLNCVGTIVMAVAMSKVYLLAGRAIAGLGTGFFTVTGPVYVGELVPNRIRTRSVSLSYVLTGGGVLAGAVFGGLFSIGPHTAKYGWRGMLGFGIIPGVLMFVCLLFTPETPRWLVFHNKVQKARLVMQKVRYEDEIEEEIGKIIDDCQTNVPKTSVVQFFKQLSKSWPVMYAVAVGSGLQIFRSLGGSAIVLTYSSTIFKMSGFKQSTAIWLAIVPAIANITAKLCSSLLVVRIGRRKLYLASSLGTSAWLFILAAIFFVSNIKSPPAIGLDRTCDYDDCGKCVANSKCGFCVTELNGLYYNGTCGRGNHLNANNPPNDSKCYSPFDVTDPSSIITPDWYYDKCPEHQFAPFAVIAVFMYVIFFAIGLAPLPWIINSEIYPTWARGNAIGLASMFSWIFSLLVSLTFLTLVDAIGQPYLFCIYGSMVFLGFLFCLFLVPETKGKDLETTESLFTNLYCLTWCQKT